MFITQWDYGDNNGMTSVHMQAGIPAILAHAKKWGCKSLTVWVNANTVKTYTWNEFKKLFYSDTSTL